MTSPYPLELKLHDCWGKHCIYVCIWDMFREELEDDVEDRFEGVIKDDVETKSKANNNSIKNTWDSSYPTRKESLIGIVEGRKSKGVTPNMLGSLTCFWNIGD